MTSYGDFLLSKRTRTESAGIKVDPKSLHPQLKPHQRAIARWAIEKGRCAIWADTGLGKSLIFLEWARVLEQRTLVFAPLGAAQQLVNSEGPHWGIPCVYATCEQDAPAAGITVTNYERLDNFDPAKWGAVVLDEADILANFSGTTKRALVKAFRHTPYRLTATATPAPNDTVELCNQADFLGVMPSQEMLSRFFTPKGVENSAAGQYRLKSHARQDFYRWLTTWAVACKVPSDLGCPDDGYLLPPLTILPEIVEAEWTPKGHLFFVRLKGVTERATVRRATFQSRVDAAVRIIEQSWNLKSRCTSGNGTSGSVPISSPRLSAAGTNSLPSNGRFGSDTTASGTHGTTSESGQSSERRERSKPSNSGRHADYNDAPTTSPTTDASSKSIERRSDETPPSPDRGTSNGTTASQSPTSSGSWLHSGASALSAVSTKTTREPASTSTTTTQPAPSADSCASTAITDSASSKTVGTCSEPHLGTSQDPLEQWVVWCGLNIEQEAVARALGDRCVSISGDLHPDEKVRLERYWREGNVPVLVTKASIFGAGMNWQHCSNTLFVGISDSYRTYFQAIRRCWRFGQAREVHAHIVLSEPERAVYENVLRKEREAGQLTREIVAAMRDFERAELSNRGQDVGDTYESRRPAQMPDWLTSYQMEETA